MNVADAIQEGLKHHQAGRLDQAEQIYRQVLEAHPRHPDALHLSGVIAYERGDNERAVERIRTAIDLQPSCAAYYNNLGLAYRACWKFAEAQACHEAALRIDPNYLSALTNLAYVLREQGRVDEALASYQEAVRRRPDHVIACHHAGLILHDLGRHQEAKEWWDRPLRTEANDAVKVRALLASPQIFQSTGHMRFQRQRLEEGLSFLESQQLSIADPLAQVNSTNFYSAYHGLNDRVLQMRLAALYARASPSVTYVAPHCRTGARYKPGQPLRIGFVSCLLHMHTIGEVNVGIIRGLSRNVCRVILFQPPGPDDNLARLIRASADEVVTLTPSLQRAREQIAHQQLDILFYPDIGLEPFTYFMAFARLAPVQCVTWGHPVTTGIPTVDYYLSSDEQEPPDADAHYSERLVRLHGLPSYYHAPAFFPPAKTRQHFGLAEDDHLYLCSQAPFKVHPDFDAVFGAILRADRRGKILFIRSQNPQWTQQLLSRFRRTLPGEIDRIQFLPHQGGQDYLHLLAVCDVLLDTTHFGGGNTTFKAFSVDMPIVTLPGEFARGRVTSACYRLMGVLDCIAKDRDDYVRIAVRLGTDRAWRQEVRSWIRAAKGVLYESTGLLRELEQFFVEAVAKVASGTE